MLNTMFRLLIKYSKFFLGYFSDISFLSLLGIFDYFNDLINLFIVL